MNQTAMPARHLPTIRRASWAASIAALLVVSGCASRPDVSVPFAGIESLISSDVAATSSPARLFVIHGMTDHKIDYADALVASLAKGLLLTEAARQDIRREVPGAAAAEGQPATVNLRTYDLAKSGKVRLRVTALTWSSLTAGIKRDRFTVDNAVNRAAINGQVKRQVINDGMGDAVLYVGAYQSVMRGAVVMSLCTFLDGEYVNGRCKAPNTPNAPIAFISASLGSIMLFDAIEELVQGESAAPMRAAIVRTRLFFMFANQLPLLDLATFKPIQGPSPASPGTGGRLQRFLREAAAPRPATPGTPSLPSLHVVAFTDPNDLLSFRLREADVLLPGVALTNVSYSVAMPWFGVFADPLVAHTGYEREPAVLGLVTCGSSGCKR